ncbi:MAG: hypothetical protein IJ849_12410 [Selenomonadaceae bacterium]|nr:hypothetical protein [Selenomonadaceae bacterium]
MTPYATTGRIRPKDISLTVTGGGSLGSALELRDLVIRHAPNEHGQATVSLVVPTDTADKFVEQVTLTTKVKVEAQPDKDKQILFLGYIARLRSENEADQTFLTLELIDTSSQVDLEKESRTFQNLSKTYQDILNTAYGSAGTVKLKSDKNKAIENMVIQLAETNWEFARRMAARFNLPLISDLTADKPSVFLGLKDGGNEVTLTTARLEQYFAAASYGRISKSAWGSDGSATQEDFTGLRVESYSYAYLGDKLKVNGTLYFVRKVMTRIAGGLLVMTYDLATKETGVLAPTVEHDDLAGRILTAQVKKVDKDLVQVHFVDLDKNYDSSGTVWLPYATAYSSRDGSGWYVMPEEGDYVRVMFPSGKAEEAFVSSAINMAPLKDAKQKSFKAPGGKEILLTADGVEIICDHQKIFVKLDKDKGISLVSAKNIAVNADGDISLDAKGKIQILAKSGIDLQAGSSHLKVMTNQVSVGGNEIKLGD